jgi:hypothetical protein
LHDSYCLTKFGRCTKTRWTVSVCFLPHRRYARFPEQRWIQLRLSNAHQGVNDEATTCRIYTSAAVHQQHPLSCQHYQRRHHQQLHLLADEGQIDQRAKGDLAHDLNSFYFISCALSSPTRILFVHERRHHFAMRHILLVFCFLGRSRTPFYTIFSFLSIWLTDEGRLRVADGSRAENLAGNCARSA